MHTLVITRHATKKRANSKLWDWQQPIYNILPHDAQVSCSYDVKPKHKTVTDVYRNFPDNMDPQEFYQNIVLKMIVMTPLGISPKQDWDAADILEVHAASNKTHWDPTCKFPAFVYHPKSN